MARDLTKALDITGKVLDTWLPLKIAYDRVPGLSVGIVHQGKLVYSSGFGLADVENAIPATAETCYRVASNSKTFTAVAAMQLVEKGRLSLDDRVVMHLPWFKARAKGLDAANITVRQAMSHLAGVFRDGDTPHWISDEFPSAAALRKSVSSQTLVFENATRFKYSNFGFAIVGAVIAKVSGQSYRSYVTENIVKPLGMTRTAAEYSKEADPWMGAGYSRPIPGEARTRFRHVSTKAYGPATGFLSNVLDLARYYSALSLARNPTKLLRRESRKELFREHWNSPVDGSYGLGFGIWRVDDKKVVGHGGGFAGYITRTALSLDDDLGVIVLTNCNDSPAGFLVDGIIETVNRLADPAREYFTGPRVTKPSRFTGPYRGRWGDIAVVATGSKLVGFDPRGNSPLKEGTTLRPATASSFVMDSPFGFDAPGERARFVMGSNGAARRIIWGSQPLERLSQ